MVAVAPPELHELPEEEDPELDPLPELDPINSHLPLEILYPEEDPLYPQVKHVPVVEQDRHVNFMLPLLPTNKLLQLEQDVAVPPAEYVPEEQLTQVFEPLLKYCPAEQEALLHVPKP
ncbi:MAG: hypothetical protein J6L82_03375 [Alphaproteobacteria bacterium]|nr:hypothetical protein [Alphaproteobacteria bacterium]